MSFTLPDLPYAKDALAPLISQETFEYHYAKHHATYVAKLNDLVADTPYADMSLEAIISDASGPLFNNAAQVWNHSFFWQCLSPQGGGEPAQELADVYGAAGTFAIASSSSWGRDRTSPCRAGTSVAAPSS